MKNKKRIIVCLLNDRMGGAEQILKMIAKYYIEKGYIIDVFFLTKPASFSWNDMKENINLSYTNSSKEYKGLYRLYRNIKRRKVCYEYGFSSHIYFNSFISLLRKWKLIKIKYLIGRDSHSYFMSNSGFKLFFYNLLINVGYSGLDLLISQTDEMKNRFTSNKKSLTQKIKIEKIANPIDMNNIIIKAKERLNFNLEQPYIVSAGRLINVKGFDILIKVFAKIKQNYKDLKLVIVGKGKEKESLQQLIMDLHLENDVILYGFIENVYPCFKEAEMCVVSSRIEGFPNVLLQMMSQNEKIVSTLCAGGIDEIKGVFTCQPNNEDALFMAMNNCLQTDTSKCRYLFDKELESRSIEKFIYQVNYYLTER